MEAPFERDRKLGKRGVFISQIRVWHVLLIGAAIWLMAGCRSEPAEKLVFIPAGVAAKMTPSEDGEVKLVWTDNSDMVRYRKVKINILNDPARQLNVSGWESSNIVYLADTPDAARAEVAKYMRQAFAKAFAASRNFEEVETADSETMILNVAIVQMIPNKPVLGAIRNITSLTPIGAIVIPVKMGMSSYSDSSGGAIAVEALLTDSTGKRVIGAFADRAKAPTSVFSIKAFTPYAGIEDIIDIWATGFVASLDDIHDGKKPNFETAPGFKFFN